MAIQILPLEKISNGMIKGDLTMKKHITYIALLSIMMTACNKNESTPVTEPDQDNTIKMVTETIQAANEDGTPTRASVDTDARFSWTEGDQIAVHVSDGKYYISETLAPGEYNGCADFSVTYPENKSRDAFAIYPADIVAEYTTEYGQSGSELMVTLPDAYKINEVASNTVPCPMIATNTAGKGWMFSQLCGMLRLSINNIPSDALYLTIDFNGKKVQGEFSISGDITPGTSSIQTSQTDGDDDIITVVGLNQGNYAGTSCVINLPLPAGTYDCIDITAFNSSDEPLLGSSRHFKDGASYNAARAKGKKLSASLVKFSVSSTKSVIFSPGNLQATYDGSEWSWAFAPSQYSYIGDATANTAISGTGKVSENGTVDLYGWVGASNQPWTGVAVYGISNSTTNNAYTTYGNKKGEALKSDWGKTIGNGNTWRTLTGGDEGEWVYLLTQRSSDYNYAKGKIHGTNGLIIFPDNYDPATDGVNIIEANSATSHYTQYSDEDWEKMETSGCVFLPAAGFRIWGNTVRNNNVNGYYWSSTSTSVSHAWSVDFINGELEFSSDMLRNIGRSVRLVRDL